MKLKNILLFVNDLSVSKSFYSDVLELPLVSEIENTLIYQVGETKLTLEEKKSESPFIYHFAINIPSNKLAEAIVWGKDRLTFVPNYNQEMITNLPTWKSESVYFFDTNGNLLEFIAREEIAMSETSGFTPSDFLNISEMAFVVDEPLKTAEEWMQEFPIGFFDKAVPTKEFLALGDDEGLIILVAKGRNWFPTHISAQVFPASMTFELAGKIYNKDFSVE